MNNYLKQQLENYWQSYQVVSYNLPLIERHNGLVWLLKEVIKLPTFSWNLAHNTVQQLTIQSHKISATPVKQLGIIRDNNPLEKAVAVLKIWANFQSDGVLIVENFTSLLSSEIRREYRELLQAALVDCLEQIKSHNQQYLLLLNTNDEPLPESLTSMIPRVNYQLPSPQEIREYLGTIMEQNYSPELESACRGLTQSEILIGISLGRSQGVNDGSLLATMILDYKVKQLNQLGLQLLPKPEIGEIGGLERIKQELKKVKAGYSLTARSLNLPLPKGWLLVGPPGTGKSFTAKVCASILGFPLISLGVDVAISLGSYKLKLLLEKIEAQAPILLFIDEFDKFFLVNNKSGEDSRSKQVLGVFLTWLQEKRSQVFVIATLNRLDALPPELIRRGRFDQNFYVGFPQNIERKQIIQLHAGRFDPRYRIGDGPLTAQEWRELLSQTEKFTGAELLALVEEAIWDVFAENSGFELVLNQPPPQSLQIEFRHLLKQREKITPLYLLRTEDILAIENRAREISEPASLPDTSCFVDQKFTLWGELLS
jgi:ATP-dependent 26S proteasome regulatory subunit